MTQDEFAAHFKLGEHAQAAPTKEATEAGVAVERRTALADVAPLQLPDYGMCVCVCVCIVMGMSAHGSDWRWSLTLCDFASSIQSTGSNSAESSMSRTRERVALAGPFPRRVPSKVCNNGRMS